ncbi:sporulation protein [Niallia endozanthoxylica]|uniref:Sporulation protein n=1 Tax=Niallia endozanthoxylica TaxID=2036016 RepID=A0A5J5HYJ1_9BACI|nr:sporulation protein [Niallia endozanthoxylica]KAA9027583.1 sporulation protein [Niallia endozanthoxylica]
MKNIQKILYVFIILCLEVMAAGCTPRNQTNQDYLVLMKTTNPAPKAIASDSKGKDLIKEIEKDIEAHKDLYDVAVIKGKEHILVVYKVKHMQRFHMKKIEKEVNEKLEKKHPGENFIVSSDYKIFLEAVRLEEKMKDPNYPEKEAEKELERIVKLKKELT